jgi:hypothetical protein
MDDGSATGAHIASFVSQARLHHVLTCLSHLHYGSVSSTHWQGDDSSGVYRYDNGSGDAIAMAWSRAGLVALAFDHELQREPTHRIRARNDTGVLSMLPSALTPIDRRANDLLADLRATHGLWIDDERMTSSDPWGRTSSGIDMLRGYALEAETALFGDVLLQNWRETCSLDEDQARLALRLARASSLGRTAIGVEDERVMLRRPVDASRGPELDDARAAAECLLAVGVAWTVPVEYFEAQANEAETSRRKSIELVLGLRNAELFEAVRADDLARVEALIAGGADLNCRTIEDQWPYTPAGDTPLIQALKKRAERVARTLIQRGAELECENGCRQRAIHWAVREQFAEIVKELLARGATPNVAEPGGDTPLHWSCNLGNREITVMLLAHHADRSAQRYSRHTPADMARARGYVELAQLVDEYRD